MLTAQEAANISKQQSVSDAERAKLIWDNQIEERIKGQASHGINFLLYVLPEFELRYSRYLCNIATELGYKVKEVSARDSDCINISWEHLV
jgi:hypothetical protein